MKQIISRRGLVRSALLASAALTFAAPARADDVVDARQVLDEAAITVERVRTQLKPDMDDALARAKAVLVIPSFYKAGFIVGAAYGDGVLVTRQPDGTFGDPAFYRMTAGSIGLQIGMNSSEVIFAIGVGAEAATTTNVGNDILAYSKASGLFAGGALEGAVIKPRKDWNAAVYGVGNDNPAAIVQRNQLRTAAHLRDVLSSAN